ncbi:nucleoid associated protein NdpA [Ruminiclostridium sufflavum DSM 19573]|uniref:Nucleoid associated protein NdpA n=1 Tax=Ruminiclostridium sufflavum DSM 19573 TaxID=1121337 RepID=A0A318XL45_9FIRM|nr:nucleoid-associated protein [Ruminiclostridium sufflavum]PYG85814.1 nucleoid associated protein NdpA [Ruminiclostridium sufflavum DSM 19573]
MEYDIQIKTAVLHILDTSISFPVLSNNGLYIDGDISEFLEKHINKILDDPNLKKAMFTGDMNTARDLCQAVGTDKNNFASASKEIANMIFDIMLKNVDIISGDLICCLLTINDEKYYGILKLNYKTGFTHLVNKMEEGNTNSIIRHKTLLPAEGQKLDEAVLINLETGGIKLIEKAYEINGVKEYYLSKYFLDCTTDLSDNEKMKIIDKVTKKINKKYYDEDFDKVAKLKNVVSQNIEDNNKVSVEKIAEDMFETNLEVRKEYIQEIQKAGLTEEAIQIPQKIAERKFKTHKIKTDTGIEINFPLSYYDNSDMIEFTNNPDGSISIIIKNVSKITNKQ